MHEYFDYIFPKQLNLLLYTTPRQHINELYQLNNTPFFGGPDWENAAADLSRIPAEDRSLFIAFLFMIIMTDQALFTYDRNIYDQCRKQKNYPKFGWFGYGIHNVNPFKLFSVPESEGLVDTDKIIGEMPNFVNFLIDETTKMLDEVGEDAASYFRSIENDPAYFFNEGNVVPAFKAAFENELIRRFG